MRSRRQGQPRTRPLPASRNAQPSPNGSTVRVIEVQSLNVRLRPGKFSSQIFVEVNENPADGFPPVWGRVSHVRGFLISSDRTGVNSRTHDGRKGRPAHQSPYFPQQVPGKLAIFLSKQMIKHPLLVYRTCSFVRLGAIVGVCGGARPDGFEALADVE